MVTSNGTLPESVTTSASYRPSRVVAECRPDCYPLVHRPQSLGADATFILQVLRGQRESCTTRHWCSIRGMGLSKDRAVTIRLSKLCTQPPLARGGASGGQRQGCMRRERTSEAALEAVR